MDSESGCLLLPLPLLLVMAPILFAPLVLVEFRKRSIPVLPTLIPPPDVPVSRRQPFAPPTVPVAVAPEGSKAASAAAAAVADAEDASTAVGVPVLLLAV